MLVEEIRGDNESRSDDHPAPRRRAAYLKAAGREGRLLAGFRLPPRSMAIFIGCRTLTATLFAASDLRRTLDSIRHGDSFWLRNMKPLDLTRFDLNLLVVLEAIWAERHVGRAAERLHLSQSATSHALSRLRVAFDDQLFIRNPRGIEPTPLAIELMPRVTEVLESVRLVASPRGPFDPSRLRATISVAATDHAVLTVIAPVLAKIQAAAPGAVLKLKPADTGTALHMLDAGDLDLALGSVSFAQLPQRFDCRLVHKERFVGIARKGHPALVKRGKKLHVDLDDFVRLPHVLVSPRGDTRGAVDDALESLGRIRKVSATCPSFLAVPFLVGASESIAVLAERVALRLQDAAQLSVFELPVALPAWEVHVIRARGRANEPAVQWMTDMLVAG